MLAKKTPLFYFGDFRVHKKERMIHLACEIERIISLLIKKEINSDFSDSLKKRYIFDKFNTIKRTKKSMTTYFYKLSLKQKIDKKMIFPEIEKMKQ